MNKIIIVHYEEDAAAVAAFGSKVEKLWAQHVNYTRQAIISIMSGLEDTAAVVDRLMKNQEDIGNAIIPFYGEAAATELTRLLKEHITIAVDIIKAVKESRSTTDLETAWLSNAEVIATFLDSADPDNWPLGVVLSVLKKHMECTIKEIKARFAKDWTADIAAYEECCETINSLAGAFHTGIVKKFPEQFVVYFKTNTIKKN